MYGLHVRYEKFQPITNFNSKLCQLIMKVVSTELCRTLFEILLFSSHIKMDVAPKQISPRIFSFITQFFWVRKWDDFKKNYEKIEDRSCKGIFVVSRMLKMTNNSLPRRFICGQFCHLNHQKESMSQTSYPVCVVQCGNIHLRPTCLLYFCKFLS